MTIDMTDFDDSTYGKPESEFECDENGYPKEV